MAKGVCFFCLDPKINVSICLVCRYKLEQAERDAERYRKTADFERRAFFRVNKENMKLKELLAKLEKSRGRP